MLFSNCRMTNKTRTRLDDMNLLFFYFIFLRCTTNHSQALVSGKKKYLDTMISSQIGPKSYRPQVKSASK